ncbi:flavin-containing amine oxidoreductase-domain containing protein [Jimgerdemannia flammicorona]|uniref:Flavin-containing amine oxidoreductase-domain containing protein n=1 Tax=Jimgerdemannia flammicorona TaxID=994334 RepID=A0A433DES5_9FUNG|nr:flavin-containing amine oxidoreductase-domain containing protein [Jimgerdemannia flammicorona]
MGAFLTQTLSSHRLIVMVFELVSHGAFRPSKLSRDSPFSRSNSGGIRARSRFYSDTYKELKNIHAKYTESPNTRPSDPRDSLFSAFLLNKAGFDVTIFEAEDHVGGRVKTHYLDKDSSDKWQYCELGAMRLPWQDGNGNDIAEHKLVFMLIEQLNDMNKQDHPDRHIELIDFILSCDDLLTSENLAFNRALTYFNDIRMTNSKAGANPGALGFPEKSLGIMNKMYPPTKSKWTIQELWGMAVQPFVKQLHESFEDGKKHLFKYDGISVRDYLRGDPVKSATDGGMLETFHIPLEEKFISSIETFNSATGLFRLAFTETILDYFTFQASKWKTISGGLSRLPQAFLPYLEEKIKFKSSVQALEEIEGKVKVTYVGVIKDKMFPVLTPENTKEDVFNHVIVTCPLGVVRRWRLPKFNFGKTMAIRTLNYNNSAKIFLQFKQRFWEDRKIKGGASSTDLKIRTVVYPSYGLESDGYSVLLASYTWANDATRWGGSTKEDVIELALRDLEMLHNGDVVRRNYTGNSAVHYWSTDPTAGGGASAVFEPGQFTSWLPDLIEPEYNIHFAGEHTDVHHSWIVGALNSAMYSFKNIMYKEGMEDKYNEIIKPYQDFLADSSK